MTTRRRFLSQATLAGAMGLVSTPFLLAHGKTPRIAKPLRVLILGGTGFIGPHFVQAALGRGHKVSAFIYRPNADKDIAALPAGVEPLLGDRNGDLQSLQDRDWDAVFDLATYGPLWVRTLADALRGRVGHYTFISSIMAYRLPGASDESSPLAPYTGDADPYSDALTEPGKYYGPLKVLCEQEAERHFPGKTLVLRPTVIVGPREKIGSMTYLAARLDKGGEVLGGGGESSTPAQWIDVRDMAEFAVRMAERGKGGIFNTLGPVKRTTCAELLQQISGILSVPARFTWVPASWLKERVPKSYGALFWSSEAGVPGSARLNSDKAQRSGMTLRPLSVTIRDTLAWYKSLPATRRAEVLLAFDGEHKALEDSMARERELLAEWHARPQRGA